MNSGMPSTAAAVGTMELATTSDSPVELRSITPTRPPRSGADDHRRDQHRIDEQQLNGRRVVERLEALPGDLRRRSIHEPYSGTNVCSGAGEQRSTHSAAGPAARMSHGVVSVVMAETATATG